LLNRKAIRLTRLYLDISQKDFAKSAGISTAFLVQVEKGNAPLSSDVNEKIVKAFEREGISEDGIFELMVVMHNIAKARKG
jgi:predicted transcriptional regulator